VSQVQESVGNFSEAFANLRKAQQIAAHLAATEKDSTDSDLYAGTYYFMGQAHAKMGDFARAAEDYQHSASIVSSALESDPNNELLLTHLAAHYAGIADGLAEQHNYSRAAQIQARVVALLQDRCKVHPEVTSLQEYLGEGFNRLGDYQQHADVSAALETYHRSHKIFGNLLSADAKNSLAKTNFAFSDLGVGRCLLQLGRPRLALQAYRESVTTFEEIASERNSNRYPRSGLANAYSGLADVYSALAAQKNLSQSQARTYWQQAHSACEKSLFLWNEKEKRGELESAERDSAKQATRCLANTQAKLARLGK
jgi:tetratricopeptide (TPR) repeat protein